MKKSVIELYLKKCNFLAIRKVILAKLINIHDSAWGGHCEPCTKCRVDLQDPYSLRSTLKLYPLEQVGTHPSREVGTVPRWGQLWYSIGGGGRRGWSIRRFQSPSTHTFWESALFPPITWPVGTHGLTQVWHFGQTLCTDINSLRPTGVCLFPRSSIKLKISRSSLLTAWPITSVLWLASASTSCHNQ